MEEFSQEDKFQLSEEWIQEAIETELSILKLSDLGLTEVPIWVRKLEKITFLDLSFNELKTLPDWIGDLDQLSILLLSNNLIEIIPKSIGNLQKLEVLTLDTNQLIDLPESMRKLRQLEVLNLTENMISVLPGWICELKHLTSLQLEDNEISDLPESILELKNLEYLLLSDNLLTRVPEDLEKISKLRKLYICGNSIKKLPKKIGELRLLEELLIYENQLTSLPKSICQLNDKCNILAEDCPLETPPLEIVRHGIPAIREYFHQLEGGKEKHFEAKLLIVGEPGAGKTTLKRKLIDRDAPLPDDAETTRGIDISVWNYSKEGCVHRVNIWDFGGQDIYHATHQFFMSRRAMYVLLADTRKQDTDYFDWLQRIQLFAGDSPIIIVHNEKDDRPKEINMSLINQRFPGLPEPLRCNLADLRGYDDVVERLKYDISQIELVGMELPVSWVRIRDKIEELVQEGTDYISQYQYFSLCEGLDHQGALVLSQYLHDIGVILHFQKDPVLKHTVILNPEWGTGAVYKAIDASSVIQNLGRFSRSDLSEIWPEDCYQGKFDELLQLMMKFQLCYEIPSQKGNYILPQLLPYQPASYQWDGENNLVLQYRYSYLLKSIMIRFIVATHELIEDHQNAIWRNGVVIKNESARAEVIADEEHRFIQVKVCGTFKKELLTIIMDRMGAIHRDFPKMTVETMVPCNCESCKGSDAPHLYPLSKLRERVQSDKETIECGKRPYLNVEILPMIDDSVGRKWVENDFEETLRKKWEAEQREKENEPEEVDNQKPSIPVQSGTGSDEVNLQKERTKQGKSLGVILILIFIIIFGFLAFTTIKVYQIVVGAVVVFIVGWILLSLFGVIDKETLLELTKMALPFLTGIIDKNPKQIAKRKINKEPRKHN